MTFRKGTYMNYLAQIEALLFVAGEEGLSLRHLASMVNLTPTALQQQLEKLAKKYESDETMRNTRQQEGQIASSDNHQQPLKNRQLVDLKNQV